MPCSERKEAVEPVPQPPPSSLPVTHEGVPQLPVYTLILVSNVWEGQVERVITSPVPAMEYQTPAALTAVPQLPAAGSNMASDVEPPTVIPQLIGIASAQASFGACAMAVRSAQRQVRNRAGVVIRMVPSGLVCPN